MAADPRRLCPVCHQDTNRQGHADWCPMASRDPEFRDVRGGPLGMGVSLSMLLWLAIGAVVLSFVPGGWAWAWHTLQQLVAALWATVHTDGR